MALVGLACGSQRPTNRLTNVLVIVVDALRADHLGCYGYARPTSPVMDRLASESVRFERAYAAAGWSKPSIASLISGLYPQQHAAQFPRSKLPDSVDTLAEILKREGYRTAAVISNVHLQRSQGFAQGYDHYIETEAQGHDHVSTPGVTKHAVRLLDLLASDERPFLLFVHYFDPHFRYQDHPEIHFASRDGLRIDGTENIRTLRRLWSDLSEQEVGLLRDLYDEEIRFTDAGIGRLLRRVRDLGFYEEALIVLTSDHGEEFRDHGSLLHGTLYEEIIRVPLLIRFPSLDGRGAVISPPVSLVSVTPTILDVLQIPTPQGVFPEPSLRGDFVPEQHEPRPVYVGTFGQRALVLDHLKLIQGKGKIEVYDLRSDPEEQIDIASQRVATTRRLSSLLKLQFPLKASHDPDEIELSEERLQILRGLGYLDD